MDRQFLHYKIGQKIGEGGMGEVYLAEDTRLKREVALKFLPGRIASDTTERKRFEIEAQAAAKLNHSGIAQVYAIEEAEGKLFIVMEYVEGKELYDVIKAGDLSEENKYKISIGVAEALHSAHQKGIIHRDIKSRNIMINDKRETKVMDFGLARVSGTDTITKEGTTLGTTAYMAPELLHGGEADTSSDIWAYGVLLYELWTGNMPFQGLYEPAIMYSIANEDPVPYENSDNEMPEVVQHLISQCLEKDPKNRIDNLGEVLEQLKAKEASTEGKRSHKKSNADLSMADWVSNRKWSLAGVFALMIAVVLILKYNPLADRGFSKKYLAVLPIENLSGLPEIDAICLGLAETLSYKLSSLEAYADEFWVAPARELRRERIETARAANEMLGVNLAILSSIQNTSDSTRLYLELVDATEIRRIGSYQVSVKVGNYEELEQKTIQAMTRMLRIEMETPVATIVSGEADSDPLAYKWYLRGKANLFYDSNVDSLTHAVTYFERALERDSTLVESYEGLGEAYWNIYETNKSPEFAVYAEQALEKAVKRLPNNASTLTMMGVIKSGYGKKEEAITHFEKALKLDPKNSNALRGLALVYSDLGDNEQAVEVFNQAIQLKPEYWEGYSDLAEFYLYNDNNIPKAIENYKKVIELTPKSSIAYSNLGVAYYYQGDVNQARAMFERSLALENNPITANNLAGIYHYERDYEKAVEMYKIALEAFDDRYEMWGNMGTAYKFLGDSLSAQDAYRAAIDRAHIKLNINRNDEVILADLATYYSDVHDSETALEYIEKAISLNSNKLRVRQRAVYVYEELGMREEALKWINESMIAEIESQPEFAELRTDERYLELKNQLLNRQATESQ